MHKKTCKLEEISRLQDAITSTLRERTKRQKTLDRVAGVLAIKHIAPELYQRFVDESAHQSVIQELEGDVTSLTDEASRLKSDLRALSAHCTEEELKESFQREHERKKHLLTI